MNTQDTVSSRVKVGDCLRLVCVPGGRSTLRDRNGVDFNASPGDIAWVKERTMNRWVLLHPNGCTTLWVLDGHHWEMVDA